MLHRVDELDLLVRASVLAVHIALDLEGVLDKLDERVLVAPAAVGLALLALPGREVLEGGVTRGTVCAAKFGLDGAVDVADDDGRGGRVVGTQFLPSRLHRLTVSAPGVVESRGRQLHCA